MVNGSTKRIVVIKDIPSNMIEEAILILKSEPKSGNENSMKYPGSKNKKLDNDFIFKEAEMIINNYIKENNLETASRKKEPAKAPGILKNKFVMNAIINLSLLGSVALLVFLITRFL